MDYLIILGYLSALVIGIALGLIGGGGSILTVPVLVYLLGVDAVTSTAYSLFIVGSTTLVGAIRGLISKSINIRIGIVFAIPSLIAVWLTRAFLIPAIPNDLFSIGDVIVHKDMAILLFFAVIMILSSVSMIRDKKNLDEKPIKKHSRRDDVLIVLEGLVVGTVTGIVGAGGGFLIIPALVLLAQIPMKQAVSTSLMIIAMKSLIGFTGDLMNDEMSMDWTLLLIFTALSIVGIFAGIGLRSKISGEKLKKGFGYFLLIMGIYMIIERLINM